MPEQDTKTPTAPAQPYHASRTQATDKIETATFSGPPSHVRRLLLIPAISVLVGSGIGLVLALQIGAWQFLAESGFLLLGLALALRGQRLVQRGKFNAAGYWLLAGICIAYGGAELILSGITLYVAIGGFLMILFAGNLALPGKWKVWLAILGGYAAGLYLINLWQPISRYDASNVIVINLFIIGVTGALVIAALWQIARIFRYGMLRARLLVAFILITIVPLTIVGATTIYLSTQSILAQTKDQLDAIAELKGIQLSNWRDDLQFELNTEIENDQEPQRIATILTSSSLSDNYRNAYLGQFIRFRSTLALRGNYDELFIINKDGRVLLSTDVAREGADYSQTTFFREALKGPYNEPLVAVQTGQLSVLVLRPYTVGDSVLGVIAGRANLEKVKQIMANSAGLGKSGSTYLVDAQYHLLQSGVLFPITTTVTQAAIGLQIPSTKDAYLNSAVPVVGAAHWLPDFQVALVAEKDEAEVVEANSTTLAIDIGLTLLALALAVISALQVTRSLTNPIAKLVNIAGRVAGGEIGLRADIERRDEVGALAESFNSMTAQLRGMIGSLESSVAERTRQLQASADVSRAATSLLDIDQLLHEVAQLITERFKLHYAAIFLIDEANRYAVLKAATGAAGQTLLARGHQLELGGQSMVSYAIHTRLPRIAQDVGTETVRFANPLLTETRSEVAVPLTVGGRVIGALDVQSTHSDTFDAGLIAVLQGLADQIAIAVNNAQQYQKAQVDAQQAMMLFEASQATSFIGEGLSTMVDRLFAVVAQRSDFDAWTAARFEPEKQAYTILAAFDANAPTPRAEANQTFQIDPEHATPTSLVIQTGRPLTVNDPMHDPQLARVSAEMLPTIGKLICVPATLGDRVLGAISLSRAVDKHDIGPRDLQLAQALANQLAVTIENRRLLDESQAAIAELNQLMALYTRQGWSQRQGTGLQQEYSRLNAKPFDPALLPQIEQVIRAKQTRPITDDGQTIVGVPITLRGEVLGTLTIQDDQDRQWTEDELVTLQAVADQVAQSIEAARLLEDSEASLQETTTLYQASRDIMAAQTPTAVLHGITTNIVTPQINRAALALIEPDSPREAPVVEIAAAWERGNDQPGTIGNRWDITQVPLIRQMTHEPLVIDDVANSPVMDPQSRHVFLNIIGIQAVIIIPMYVGDHQLGWLLIESQSGPYHFTEQEIRRFRTLAGQATIALENRRLFQDVEARVGELTVLTRISRRLASTLNLQEVLALIADDVLNVTPATHASLALYNEAENALEIQLVRGSTPEVEEAQMGMLLRAGTGLHGRLMETGQSVLVADVRNEPDYIVTNEDTISEFIVPIRQGDLLLGALNLESPKPDAFDQANVRLVEALADQAAIAISNARSYEAERAAVERIREVDRLKTQFLANMSHELRTPLNSIIGFSRVIMRGIDGPLTDLQSTDLQSIYSSGQHLLGLINNILDISKIEAGKMEMAIEPIDLHEIAKSVMSTAIALVKDKSVKLEQDVPESLPPVNADPTRVRQIILNLISNAAKFTEQGFIRLRILPMPTEIQISVTDTGIGIPPSKLNSIFEEFTQADASTTRRYGGTGLGLAITRRFVELHKGRVWVESQEGVGSTFTFTLPLEIPPDQASIALPVDLEARGEGKKLVMCIDDDPGVITLYKRYLEKQGYQVIGITDSSKAVEEARRLLPFAITLDVLMPNRDGWSVLADLKSAPEISRIPIVVCSIIQDKTKGFSLGAADYLVKPITEDELLRALEHVNHDKTIHRVLVVDDEPEARLLIKRILESQTGLEVLEALGGAQALADIMDIRPDLIILDLMMPDIDGFTVLDNVKSNPATRDIPVIIVTAKEITEEDRHRLEGKTLALFNKGMFAAEQLMTDIANALTQMNGPAVEAEKVAVSQ